MKRSNFPNRKAIRQQKAKERILHSERIRLEAELKNLERKNDSTIPLTKAQRQMLETQIKTINFQIFSLSKAS